VDETRGAQIAKRKSPEWKIFMPKAITYKTSGVDIDKANAFITAIKGDVASTKTSSVIERKGAFGGLFALAQGRYKNPVLVSSTDGVGTKLLVAQAAGIHDTVGIDLVAMNVNDILCVGAKPLFFLDYIACGRVNPKVLQDVVKGIAEGCRQSGCSLVGGETAEMPGMYDPDEYDLAGFVVGIVERNKIIDGSAIKAGDHVIGLPSSGLHSNGFSLVRKVLSRADQKKYVRELLTPTRIYAGEILGLLDRCPVEGVAHITGGAFYEKLTKILPQRKCFVINKGSWPVPDIFQMVQKKGGVDDAEMYRTFNMGVGLALVLRPTEAPKARAYFKRKKIKFYDIGHVVNDPKRKIVI
jgi:phosphoribosylformylglycinamidine cyclo-ligase